MMLMAPVNSSLQKNEAHAIFGIADTTIIIGDLGPQFFKEFALDNIAFMLARAAVNKMVQSTVRWINSGFKGSPSFVTDLDGFLLNVADEVAGDFIDGTELGFLCSPFQLNIRAALATQYYQTGSQRDPYACTLSGVVDNVGDFIDDGNVNSWGRWFQVTTRPQNNQYGAFALAQGELDARITNARGEEIQLLNFSGGFLSFEECTQLEGGGEECTITTPGRVIADSLNKSLGAGQDSLIQADEINEIVGALLGQLVNQVLGGAGGLLGASSGGYSRDTSRPYLDRLNDESDTLLSDAAKTEIKGTQNLEKQIRNQYAQIQSSIAEIQSEANRIVDENSCSISTTLPSALTLAKSAADTEVSRSTTNINTLDRLLARYDSDPTETAAEFESLKEFEIFHTTDDISTASYLQNDVSVTGLDFISNISSSCGSA